MVGREGRIGGGEKKKGKREVGRGPIEGSTMKKKASWQAALWKSVDLNSTANNHLICHSALALFFFFPLHPAKPCLASYFHAFESHNRTRPSFSLIYFFFL